MWLQLTTARVATMLCAASVVGCGAPMGGVVSSDLRSAVYHDSDYTTIGTNTVAVRARPSNETTLMARYLVDVTTSASVDVVSAATSRWDEVRHEVSSGTSVTDGTSSANASYTWSLENDWESHTAAGGVSRDFADHDLTLAVSGSYVMNAVSRADDPNFAREMRVVSASFHVAVVAGPSDLVSTTYSLGWVDGYQASPYRFARFRDPAGGPLALTMPESHPDTRWRHAVSIRWNHAFGASVALRTHARLYTDDWGVDSLTLGTELRGGIGEWELGLSVRGYGQLGATFYEDVYAQPMRYMTSDRELSTFWDLFGGPVIGWRSQSVAPFEELRLELGAKAFLFRFSEYARLPTRFGLVAELAIGATF